MKQLTIFCFLILLFAGMTFAAVDNNKVQELNMRYNYIVCRVNLVQSQAGLLSTYGTISGIDKITSDFASLKSLADSGNPADFNAQVQTLNSDFKMVNDGLKAARQAFSKSNISQSDRDSLKSQWNTTLQTYQSCNLDARRGIVSARIAFLQANIDDWNRIIANMTARGLDTTELAAVVTDAQKLVSDLNSAVQAADDNSFKTMLDNANDEQNHLWARFAIGRIKSNIARVEPIIGQTNLSGDIGQINSLLDTASTSAAPGHKYGAGEFQQTWQDIKDATQMLNTMSKDLRKYEMAARQNGRLGNNTNPRNMTNRPIRANITGVRSRIGFGRNQSNPSGNPPEQSLNTSGDGQ